MIKRLSLPYTFDHPQIAGREEALSKLGIPSPSPHEVNELFPDLVAIRLQQNRWKAQMTDEDEE